MNLGNPDQPVGGLAVPRPPGVEIRPLAREDLAAHWPSSASFTTFPMETPSSSASGMTRSSMTWTRRRSSPSWMASRPG